MPSIKQRQQRVGGVVGAAAFATGVGATALVVPAPAQTNFLGRSLVTFLSVLGVPLGLTPNPLALGTSVKVLLLVTAMLSSSMAGFVAIERLPYTERPTYVFKNGVCLVYGYVATGLLMLVIVAPTSATSIVIFGTVLVVGSVYVGARVVGAATGGLPVFGVVSLAALAATGFLILFAGLVVIRAVVPLVIVPLLGGTASATLAIVARRA